MFLGLFAGGIAQAAAAMAAAWLALRILSGETLQGTAPALAAVALVAALLNILIRRGSEVFAQSFVHELRMAFFGHVMRAPADGKSMRYGLVMTRIVNDFSAIKLWLSDGLVTLAIAVAAFATVFAFLALVVPGAVVPMGIAFGTGAALTVLCILPLHRAITALRRERGRLASKASMALNGRLSFLAFGRYGSVMRSLERRSQWLRDHSRARASWSGAMRATGDLFLPAFALAGLAVASASTAIQLPAESLGLVVFAAGFLAAQFSGLSRAADCFLAHRIATARLRSAFPRPALQLNNEGAKMRRRKGGRGLQATGACLSDSGTDMVLAVNPGSVALACTTDDAKAGQLAMAIAGLVEVPDCSISLDGQDINDTSRRDWLRSVALLSPALPLVNGTVARNMALGQPTDQAESELIRVAASFGLDEDVLGQEIREDTNLPAETLAAIAAARSILRGPSLIVVHHDTLLRARAALTTLLELASMRGTTVLVVTADLLLAEAVLQDWPNAEIHHVGQHAVTNRETPMSGSKE